MDTEKVELLPILDADATTAATFLHEHLNAAVSVASWRALLAPPWTSSAPNSGFQLVGPGGVVGVYAAVYSDREVDGERRQFCNLAAFCVREDYRGQSFRLLRAVLGQKDFEFTDLSPSGNVVALNERMKFARLDTATTLAANLPRGRRRGILVSSDRTVVESTLTGADAAIYRDHQDAAAARHVVIVGENSYSYLIFRKDRRKRLPIFATPLYVGGDRELIERAWPHVRSHLLTRHRLPIMLAEHRVVGFIPAGWALKDPRVKMFRSTSVPAQQIDYLYSELTLLEW